MLKAFSFKLIDASSTDNTTIEKNLFKPEKQCYET